MEETAEFRISRTLIVDEFYFHRFHWRDSENSFTHTSAQAGQQFAGGGQLSIVILHLSFKCLEWAKPTEMDHRKVIRETFCAYVFFCGIITYRTADFGMLP